jgi:hypothetical protein
LSLPHPPVTLTVPRAVRRVIRVPCTDADRNRSWLQVASRSFVSTELVVQVRGELLEDVPDTAHGASV